VVLRTAKALFSKQSPLWKTELTGLASVFLLAESREENPIESALRGATACFNVFVATTKGDISWRFTGKMPVRAKGLDPRLPTPSRPDTEWKGFLSDKDMPHVFRPKGGLLANWNNKPARWFPNGDTPAWGRFFRSRLLDEALGKGKLGRGDLERAIWTIARRDAGHPEAFHGLWTSKSPRVAAELAGFDGWALEGSGPALVHRTAVQTLRQELFSSWIGNLTSPAFFNLAIQPEVIWAAAQGKTKFDYLQGRSRPRVIAEVMEKVEASVWGGESPPIRRGFRPGAIAVPNQAPIPYIDRGTYIQITEMTQPPTARSIASPGVQEEGPQALNQTPLARAWQMKPCWQFN
jgi:penicillin amidase